MTLVKEFGIILLISFLGEVLHVLLPLPIPSSIYGLVLMLVCLITGVIRLEQVNRTSRFLIEIMPLMFIPAGVGLLSAWGVLKPVLLPVAVITVVTTVLVMVVAGWVTQGIRRLGKQVSDDE